ncbi:reverse transcriptase domain-containing protein [Tanacetum coccineum]
MEKTYTWIEAKEVAFNGAPNDKRDNFKSPREILATEKVARSFEQPPRMLGRKRLRDMSKFCYFHEDHGHDTNDCRQLRSQIEEVMRSGQLSHLVKGIKKERTKTSDNQRGEKKEESTIPAEAPILMINKEEVRTKYSTNADVCAWTYDDMTGIPRTIMIDEKPFNMEHKLNQYSYIKPIKQKRRSLGPDRSTTTRKEVEELTRAGILQEAVHQTWVANPFMVKKSDRGWRMLALDPNGRRRGGQYIFLRRRRSLLLSKDALWSKKRRSNISKIGRQVDTRSRSNTPGNEDTYGNFGNAHSANTWRSSNNVSHSFDRKRKCCFIREKGKWTSSYLLLAVITNSSIKQALTKLKKSGRVAKWAIKLGEHDIMFQTRDDNNKETPKDFLIKVPPEDNRKETEIGSKPEETKPSHKWKLYTDGASNSNGLSTGLILIDLKGKEYTYALRFKFKTTNNEAEYEALLAGLRISQEMEIINLAIFIDS